MNSDVFNEITEGNSRILGVYKAIQYLVRKGRMNSEMVDISVSSYNSVGGLPEIDRRTVIAIKELLK